MSVGLGLDLAHLPDVLFEGIALELPSIRLWWLGRSSCILRVRVVAVRHSWLLNYTLFTKSILHCLNATFEHVSIKLLLNYFILLRLFFDLLKCFFILSQLSFLNIGLKHRSEILD